MKNQIDRQDQNNPPPPPPPPPPQRKKKTTKYTNHYRQVETDRPKEKKHADEYTDNQIKN